MPKILYPLRVTTQTAIMLYVSRANLSSAADNFQCTALANSLPEQVYYNPGSELKGFRDQYYSTFQRDVIPACVVTPSSGDDVSQALQIIKQHRCIFAVKSGGHSMFTGASNAPSAITLDLKMFDDVVPDEAGLVTRVGTGNRWADVYKVLEPLNRMVVGGRHSGVGVGGFILGGVSDARL